MTPEERAVIEAAFVYQDECKKRSNGYPWPTHAAADDLVALNRAVDALRASRQQKPTYSYSVFTEGGNSYLQERSSEGSAIRNDRWAMRAELAERIAAALNAAEKSK